MKLHTTLSFLLLPVLGFLFSIDTGAQQYKLRQSNTMTGMKTESTIYVKGPRKRTEGGGFMGMSSPTTIEQCDLKRTIKINDKKKLYFIEPFAKVDNNEEPVKQAAKPTPVEKENQKIEKGGTIYFYSNITDTGERKKMYGFTARHIWTTQKIKPSADACSMKDSMIIKTDGWYIDLPEFNCPVTYSTKAIADGGGMQKRSCQDKFVTKSTGKGKLGFPLIVKTTMIMGNKDAQTFETNLETLEFSTAKLDSMLFEIPPGYKLAASEEELQDKWDKNAYMEAAKEISENYQPVKTEEKKSGMIRIGIYAPKTDEQLDPATLQKHMVRTINNTRIESMAVSSEEEAKKYNCDYVINTEFTKVKPGSKVGGIIKAIKNTDPTATSSFAIDANLVLVKLSDGSTKSTEKVSGKFDGKVEDAAKRALDKGCMDLVSEL